MPIHGRARRRGATTFALIVALLLFALAGHAAAVALGWVGMMPPAPRWALWLAAALCTAGGIALLRAADAARGAAATPESLAAAGDFSDPVRLAASAIRPVPARTGSRHVPAAGVPLSPAARDVANDTTDAVRLPAGTRPVVGITVALAILLPIHWIAFRDWDSAPAVPIMDGIDAISFGRIAVVFVDLLLLVLGAVRLVGKFIQPLAEINWHRIIMAALAAAAILEGSGALREAYRSAIATIGRHAGNREVIVASPTAQHLPRAPTAAAPARPAVVTQAPHAATVNCAETATLHAAAASGCIERLAWFVGRQHEQIEARDSRGLTPLATAVLGDQMAAAELLLKAAADSNARVKLPPAAPRTQSGLAKAQTPVLADDSTPLILARSAPTIVLLLRYGADPALKNDYGWSAIFYATRNGDADMIHALVAGGANVNDTADVDPSHAGSTPLMWAAFMNLLPQLDALLEHKPRLDIRDRAGNTALDYAMRFRHHEAVARLTAAAGRQ